LEATTPDSGGAKKGAGYIAFAGTLFLVLGAFNIIDGIVALAGDDNFAESELFFGSLGLWGVILLVLGTLQLVAGGRLFQGRGQLLAVTLLMLNLVAQFFFLPAFPVWSVIIMVVDLVLIYGLTMYGENFERT
jgi:hypothetical protein